MRYRLSRLALIATAALLWTGCASTRTLRSDVRSQMYEVTRDTVREQVMVAVHDTIREVTTITVQLGQAGDTLRMTQVTDRDRIRSKADVRSKRDVVRVERDTVYVAVRDSVLSFRFQDSGSKIQDSGSRFVSALKWIFWILVAGIVLIIVVKLGKKGIL